MPFTRRVVLLAAAVATDGTRWGRLAMPLIERVVAVGDRPAVLANARLARRADRLTLAILMVERGCELADLATTERLASTEVGAAPRPLHHAACERLVIFTLGNHAMMLMQHATAFFEKGVRGTLGTYRCTSYCAFFVFPYFTWPCLHSAYIKMNGGRRPPRGKARQTNSRNLLVLTRFFRIVVLLGS